jgi:PAS domain S-box-containing protein
MGAGEPSDEVERLQASIDDLITVFGLPAVWIGQDPALVASTLLEALLDILRLDVAFARVPGSQGALIDVIRLARSGATEEAEVAKAEFALLAREDLPASGRRIPSPGRDAEMTVVAFPLGLQDEHGLLIVGSRRAGFPAPSERLVLQVAANQAAIGLRESLVLSERRLAEEMLERRVAERTRELRESERRLRLLAEAIPHQVWGARPDGTLNYCNQRRLDYVGLSADEACRERWEHRIHPGDEPLARAAWRRAEAERRPYEAEFRLRGRDGSYRRFVSRGVPVYDDEGRLAQWFGTHTDVEERRRAEEALREAQQEVAHATRLATLGELAASLAHELNQPLTAVVANGSACLRWLRRDVPDVGEAVAAVEHIIRDGNHASAVIAETRALLKKSDGTRAFFDIVPVIGNAVLLLHREALEHRAKIREEHTEELPPVWGVRVQLQQVVVNLIVNAIEAMVGVTDRPRELLVRTALAREQGRRWVLVAVRDVGVGVPAGDFGRLFEPFYTTKPEGLGMGLSIVRSIIRAHGGRLWATPNPGHGLTVRFMVPGGERES